MRYHVKGGIWKNTEDEILKAAVMKYGLNQWSRISSLLVRKSAKQCKERWYEWLDPKIKKTEWTKDEEEKLLQLAKMFPCQWKTIAPFVGRTAYQCIEHYEYLLDKAQGRENDPNDPRKLRPGEIDPNPEAKPARPDPIDLDEDTKETLNEARARVANTRGKKAKRKIREKQLEEARRLAALQKKRELKSAGIEIVLRLPKKKKKEMNYNSDVPFMREVPKGSFSDMLEPTPEPDKFKGGISLQYLEKRERDREEEKQRKIDEKRMKNLKQKDLPKAIEMINKMNDPMNTLARGELVLPEPQTTEMDLKEISKLSSGNKDDNRITNILTGDYSQSRENAISSVRTPQTEDKILTEARIAISLREGQTPLIGGEDSKNDLNFYLSHRTQGGFKTPLPVNMNKTPGPPSETANRTTLNSTTPMRDEMNINTTENNYWENDSSFSYGNLDSKNIKSLFNNLPKPKNTFEVTLDNEGQDDQEDKEFTLKKEPEIKDAEDIQKEKQIEEEKERQREEILLSGVIKNKLPRINLNSLNLGLFLALAPEKDDYISKAEEMIREETIKLINKDNKEYPFKGMSVIDFGEEDEEEEELEVEEKELIEELIKEELGKVGERVEVSKLRSEVESNVIFLGKDKGYCYKEKVKNERIAKLESDFNFINKQYEKEASSYGKLLNKNEILTKGLKMKFDQLYGEYEKLVEEINDLRGAKEIYSKLLEEEKEVFLKRKEAKEKELRSWSEKEAEKNKVN